MGGQAAYQHYQNLIDQREGELESQGTDPSKLYFSDNSEHLRGAPGWSQMPDDLENLYRLRDSAGSTLLQGSIGDIQDRLASVGIKGDEANRILDMYALDPDRTDAAKQYLAAEHAQAAAGRPWDEQVRDAYIRLANQRDIPMDNDDDLYRDKQTTRDARNAVEQVISYFHPEADSDRETAPQDSATGPEIQQGNQPVRDQAITLSPDEVENAPLASQPPPILGARPVIKPAQKTFGTIPTRPSAHGRVWARTTTCQIRSASTGCKTLAGSCSSREGCASEFA